MDKEEYDKLSTEAKINHLAKKKPTVKNLTPHKKGTEAAREFSRKGNEKLAELRLKRDALRNAVAAFGKNKLKEHEDLTSLDTLHIIRNLYIAQEDWDKVVEISKVLAEYEAPKKSRVEEVRTEIDFNEFKEQDVEQYLSDVISLDELRARKQG